MPPPPHPPPPPTQCAYLAPVLEVLEQRVELVVGVALKVAVDGDVAPVADLLAEVGRVHDELWAEEGVLAVLGEEAEVEGEVEIWAGGGRVWGVQVR